MTSTNKSCYKSEKRKLSLLVEKSYNKTVIDFNIGRHYTIIDFNEMDIRIYLPKNEIIHRGR